MWLRDWIRRWLGFEEVKVNQAGIFNAVSELRAWISEENLASHNCSEDRHGELIERLECLEQHFVAQHVGTKPASIPVYDWEQVQLNELATMLANPPKEEN